MSLTGTVMVRPLCSYAWDHFMLAFPFNRRRRQVSRFFLQALLAAGAQPSQGWSYSWELRQIERANGFQPGGEGTLPVPIDIPAEPRAHLGGLLREAAAAELPHK